MLKNYLKIAIRNLRRHVSYSIINIIGLTVGLTAACFLFLYVSDELKYDQGYAKSDRIARVVEVEIGVEGEEQWAFTSGQMGPALVEAFPNVVNQVRLIQPFGHINLEWKGERTEERNWVMADSTYFQIFDFEFIEGDPETALDQPNSVVIRDVIAEKYFGDEPALGKVLPFIQMEPVKITGVIKTKKNITYRHDVILSRNDAIVGMDRVKKGLEAWDRLFSTTFVELASPDDLTEINKQLPEFVSRFRNNVADLGDPYLQANEDIYLNSTDIESHADVKGSWFYVYLFIAIGLFILSIACINYVNLATARSTERAREIGIRKVSGAYKKQLIFQFLSESVLISGIAFFLSVGLVDVLLPFFSSIAGKELVMDVATFFKVLQVLFAMSLFTGLVAGLYPAFYLASLKPSQTLKGEISASKSGLILRKSLVIFQFTLSIIMIIATIVMYQQMEFVNNKSLGFDKEHILNIDINAGNVRRNFSAMKDEFSKISQVTSVATSSRLPGDWKYINQVTAKTYGDKKDSLESYFMAFDEDMLSTYDLKLMQGENFRGSLGIDSSSLMINETAARQIFGEANPVGEKMAIGNVAYPFTVVGVIKDFNFQSLHQPVRPLLIGYYHNPVTAIDYFSLKIAPHADYAAVVEAAKGVHLKFDDYTAMEYHFLDSQLDLFYRAEIKAQRIFEVGAFIAILIACMGLFGLSSFLLRKRVKEVSIRKVLGASTYQLFLQLSKTFVFQVLTATVIAVPLAWWLMDSWLNYFTYHVEIGVVVFVVAGFFGVLITVLTTGYQTIKTTRANPATTLKSE
ncbi:ABC transporter permease [Fulvivirga maritima]|uniref:ABC transporter permease n=1 Tax=Fulvivirga maritima TaxID=2904247 RepID=UPI001F387087|nr:ABC transporter permease [Fulvivirga maritima]UII29355.1 ABC transporter permease [Fulvivirga maritima]